MMYVNEHTMDRLVRDRHESVAELYARTRRPSLVAAKVGSLMIRVGEWLRHDVEVPCMPVVATPDLQTGGCEG